MKGKKSGISLFMLIAFAMCIIGSTFAYAAESYPTAGSPETDGDLGPGLWNDDLGLDYAIYSRSLVNPKFSPLVDDLNGDGINEIVIFDSNAIKVYSQESNTLILKGSQSLPSAEAYSPPIIYDITPSGVTAPQSLTGLFTPSKDTYLSEAAPTQNFGSSVSLLADRATASLDRIILQFDLSTIPEGSIINSAVLRMNATAEAGAIYTIEAHRMTAEWNENSATWTLKDGTNTWTSSGGDFHSAFTYATANAPDGAVFEMNMTLTALVNDWVQGTYENYGIMLDEQAAGTSALKTFHSREALAGTPRLFVNYTTPQIIGATTKEILIGHGQDTFAALNISIITYNGSIMTRSVVNITRSTSTGGFHEIALACEAQDKCMAIWNDEPAASNNQRTRAAAFNSSIVQGPILDVRTSTTERACFPLINRVSVDDVDADDDGKKEYVFSMFYSAKTAGDLSNDFVRGYIINRDNNQAALQLGWNVDTGLNIVDTSGASCTTSTGNGAGEFPQGKFVSAPLVFDMEGVASDGLDILIAHSVDPDEWVMRRFDDSGSSLDRYPSILNADGRILSNPFKANAFPKTDIYKNLQMEACVIGQETSSCEEGGGSTESVQCIDMLCASEVGAPDGVESEEYIIDLADYANFENISVSFQDYSIMAHAVQTKEFSTDGSNLDEVLTSYGTFEIDWDTGVIAPDNALFLSWQNPSPHSATIMVDYQKDGNGDIIAMGATNLYYFDDLFSNQPADISAYQISPCIESAWQANTTVNILVTPTDAENDDISARALLYYNGAAEQDSGWSGDFPSGTAIPITFTASDLATSATLRLMARDTSNSADIDADVIDIPFSVSNSGIETNDCTTVFQQDTEAVNTTDETLGITPLDPQDNVVINPIRSLAGITKLGVLGTFLLILLIFNIYVLVDKGDILHTGNNMKYTLLILGVIDIMALILGVITSVVPFGVIVFLTIIGLLVLAFMLKDRLGGIGG